MSGLSGAVQWAGAHPVPTAIGVFATGAILLLLLKGGSSGGSGDGGMSAFYAATASQAASSATTQQDQIQANAATAIAGIQGTTAQNIASTSANAQVATNQSDNDLAAYQTYKQVRLQTQQSEFGYELNALGLNSSDYASELAAVNATPLTFGH